MCQSPHQALETQGPGLECGVRWKDSGTEGRGLVSLAGCRGQTQPTREEFSTVFNPIRCFAAVRPEPLSLFKEHLGWACWDLERPRSHGTSLVGISSKSSRVVSGQHFSLPGWVWVPAPSLVSWVNLSVRSFPQGSEMSLTETACVTGLYVQSSVV